MNTLIYLPQLLQSALTTLELMVYSLILGLVLALLLTFTQLTRYYYLKLPVNALVFFVRGTPLLVQIFLIYYGSGQFTWLKNSMFWFIFREPFFCAIIALAINTAAYTSVLLKGAIDSVPHEEKEACQALGMSKWLMIRRIILPRAFSIAIPAYSNEVIMILKGTALVSTITILDLMGTTQQLIARTYNTIPLLLLAGAIYLILNGLIVGTFKILEYRANVYLHH